MQMSLSAKVCYQKLAQNRNVFTPGGSSAFLSSLKLPYPGGT